ncbi:hypothetical protein [Algoriphagus terrigena]|uniref:hypothetical protein n=1 Tax=Algoriphagus terrigena TaxID=344884 RepID=UPI00054D0210|nr:hypothetical protein [Algoriphagus terrigena]
MNRTYPKILLLTFISIFSFSCDEKDDPTPTPSPYPDLSTFTERFLAEAKARGLNLNASAVDVAYVDEIKFADGSIYCGYGWTAHPDTGKRTVYISKSSPCAWSTLSDLKREQFFFHEIGHAFLNRTHDNAALCDGSPITLMNSQVHALDYYDGESEKKKYYLDELFDRSVGDDKCIESAQNWSANPTFVKHQTGVGSWIFYDAKGTMTGSRSPADALVIASVTGKTSTETGYWRTELEVQNIPVGATVTLRTKVSSAGLTGPGVAVGLRGYEFQIQNTGAVITESFVSSTEANPVSGVLEQQTIEISFLNVTRKTVRLIPFAVMMPGTQGEAIFEDFEIIVEV